MRSLTIDQVAGAFFAVFSLLVLWESRKIAFGFLAEPGPGAVPVLLALTLFACSVVLVITGRGAKRMAEISWSEWRHGIAILGTSAFMALALERLGYRLTILVALLVLVSVVEKRSWIAGAIFAGGFAFGTYYLFDVVLQVPLPQGAFGF
jgi:putative tricarboxylic transport membrane protein